MLLFPLVKKLFTADELDAMGSEMLDKFTELMSSEPRRTIPSETAEAAPL